MDAFHDFLMLWFWQNFYPNFFVDKFQYQNRVYCRCSHPSFFKNPQKILFRWFLPKVGAASRIYDIAFIKCSEWNHRTVPVHIASRARPGDCTCDTPPSVAVGSRTCRGRNWASVCLVHTCERKLKPNASAKLLEVGYCRQVYHHTFPGLSNQQLPAQLRLQFSRRATAVQEQLRPEDLLHHRYSPGWHHS